MGIVTIRNMPSQEVSMSTDHSIEEPCEVTNLTHGFGAERRRRLLRLGSALYERLHQTGLPVETGTGGRTKVRRVTQHCISCAAG